MKKTISFKLILFYRMALNLFITKLLSPRQNLDSNTLAYWRERIFYAILLGGSVLGVITMVPSIMACIQDGLYIQIAVDLIVFVLLCWFLFDYKIPYEIKSGIFLFLIYGLGISLILVKGPYASGFIYLVCFSVIASVWRGMRMAIISILINLLSLFIIGFISYNHIASINGFESYNLTKWISLGTNVFLANSISAISVGLLLDGLGKALQKTTELKDQLSVEKVKLIEAKQKAEESDNLKSAFLANMSHELKTPLNSICGFSNYILDDKVEDLEQIYSFQEMIAESGDMLLQLINDILDFSSIEAGQLRINKKNILLHDTVSEVENCFGPQVVSELGKDVKLIIQDKKTIQDFEICTDSLRLKQVINNLIKNALKFTDKGEVHFNYEVDNHNNEVLFKVKDTGIGIDPKLHNKIFERFYKLNETGANPIKGTGLGLAISKEIVENLGGKIWVDSKVGEGSCFFFTTKIN